jgi:hypothetical protein
MYVSMMLPSMANQMSWVIKNEMITITLLTCEVIGISYSQNTSCVSFQNTCLEKYGEREREIETTKEGGLPKTKKQ